MLLVEARPRAVGRDALYQALWPDTFVVEANLSNLIGEIRAGLGDSAQHARVIRTLHGFGYAFAAEAEVVATEPGEAAALAYLIRADGQAARPRRSNSYRRRSRGASTRLHHMMKPVTNSAGSTSPPAAQTIFRPIPPKWPVCSGPIQLTT